MDQEKYSRILEITFVVQYMIANIQSVLADFSNGSRKQITSPQCSKLVTLKLENKGCNQEQKQSEFYLSP